MKEEKNYIYGVVATDVYDEYEKLYHSSIGSDEFLYQALRSSKKHLTLTEAVDLLPTKKTISNKLAYVIMKKNNENTYDFYLAYCYCPNWLFATNADLLPFESNLYNKFYDRFLSIFD